MTNTLAHRHRIGFTMIELVTVLAVTGVMLAIAAPRFRVSEAMEVQIAARQLAHDLDYARTRALATRSIVRVSFDLAGRTYSGYLDVDGDGIVGGTLAERRGLRGFGERALPERVEFARGSVPSVPNVASGGDAISFPGAAADFNSRGIVAPLGSSGAVYVRHRVKTKHVAAVAVTAAGNVRLWTWKDGTWQ
jgi:prepilin-type N-terminal cleavage/methylation domain-containing protein